MDTQLLSEELETRQMLSTVSFTATGETGEENLVVTVGEQTIIDQVVSTQGEFFEVELAEGNSIEDLRIRFTNDLFEPGRDRNLTINRLNVDGREFDFSSEDVFSTGSWVFGSVEPGFGRGNTLHSNGFFQFEEQASTSPTIDFNGIEWQVSRNFTPDQIRVDSQNNELVLGGISREISIATEVDFVPGALSSLTVDAWRNQISGSFAGSAAGAGVDFLDADGQVFRQFSFQLNENANDPSDRVQTQSFIAPEEAVSAYLWVWVDGFPQQTNIPLRLTDLRLEQVDTSDDVNPPTITLLDGEVTRFRDDAFFSVEIADDFEIPGISERLLNVTLELTDPAGNIITPVLAAGGGGGISVTSQTLVYRINEEFDTFDQLILGDYEVRLVGDELVDGAGNVAPPQFIGVFNLFER